MNREYECSGSRMNEAGPIRDQYIREIREILGCNSRGEAMKQSGDSSNNRRGASDWRGSPDWGYKRRRFDEMRHEQEQYPTRPRFKNGDCHFYLEKGWCGYGRDCVFNHPTPSDWRFDERRRHETEFPENMATTMYGSRYTWRESGYGEAHENNNIWWQRRTEAPENVWEQRDSSAGWLSYDERRRNPATREILMRPARRIEQRDRERQARNEGANNRESSPELGTEKKRV